METLQDLPQEPILPSETEEVVESPPGQNWALIAGAIVVAVFVIGLIVLAWGGKGLGRQVRKGVVPTATPTFTSTPTPMKTGANEAIDKALEDLDKTLNEVDAALQGIDSDLAENDSVPDI
jgi:hypothetical protein